MFKIKKSFCKMVVAALLTLIVLASCSPSKSTPQFKLRIGLFPVQDYLPFFVMQENGFDKQNGLQFGETSYAGGAAIIDAIVAGLLDVGYVGSVPVFTAAERGLMRTKLWWWLPTTSPTQIIRASVSWFPHRSRAGKI